MFLSFLKINKFLVTLFCTLGLRFGYIFFGLRWNARILILNFSFKSKISMWLFDVTTSTERRIKGGVVITRRWSRLNLILKLNPRSRKDTVSRCLILLKYVYTLRLIGPISYLGGCYRRTKVTKCIRQKMTLYFRMWTIKSHSPGYEIGPINRSV